MVVDFVQDGLGGQASDDPVTFLVVPDKSKKKNTLDIKIALELKLKY